MLMVMGIKKLGGIKVKSALGKFLAFSRAQEGTADASGARYLSASGISGKGSINYLISSDSTEDASTDNSAVSDFYLSNN